MCREYVRVDATTGATALMPQERTDGTCLVTVSQTEVLVVRDRAGYLLGSEGRLTRRSPPIPWTSVPLALGISLPYAVAALDGGFEVRPLEPLSNTQLVQRLESPKANVLLSSAASDGSLFYAASAVSSSTLGARTVEEGLWRLVPLSFMVQAERLLAAGEYEEALAVAGIDTEGGPETARLKSTIHARYGRALFAQGQYNDGLLHISMSNESGTLQLLQLLPSLTPADLLEKACAREVGAVGSSEKSEDVGSVQEPEGEEFNRAVSTLLPYLLSHRSRLAAASASEGQVHGVPGSGGQRRRGGRRKEQTVRPLATLLDTAILKALLVMPDSGALLQYVQRPNCVDLETGELVLRDCGRYSELVALYQGRQCHAQALQLLQALSQHPETLQVAPQGAANELRGYPGVWAAVRYMSHLGPEDAHLITAHAK